MTSNIPERPESLEELTEPSLRKVAVVDTIGNNLYGLVVGGLLDYNAGLDLTGILASRTYAAGMNTITGAPYGWWREQVFRFTGTTEEDNRMKRTAVDLLAFNTFQLPFYATVVAIGSLVSEGKVDMEKVEHGALSLALISPLIGPSMGWFLDGFRRVCGVRTAAEGAYGRNEQ
ncbi:hypothetical protein COV20_03080 [Candidatus Woesearchaeota archaeon CG10_big_fil_rev_8_21_14_0_10_45_16]|nr:MAG: hypothetical protein COV20_03080 [Candidatus Woesearchaeota archaeon CG10_big_fil_rev_8_21_14_0_10_45_16]